MDKTLDPFSWQWVLLIPQMGRMDKQNSNGEDKSCTSQKIVKLRRHQGERMRETTEISWRYESVKSFLNDTLYNWWFNYLLVNLFSSQDHESFKAEAAFQYLA